MVYSKKDPNKAFSPNKVRKFTKRRLSANMSKPSTSGSTIPSVQSEGKAQTGIKVIVRVRPPNERELQNNYKIIIKIVDDKMLVFDPKEEENPFYFQGVIQKGRDLLKKQNKELQFIFDRIFDMSSTNTDVFEESTKDLITALLEGYNCSVFAYGATGAGKTHTMLGSANDPGITYRTVAELFSQMESQSRHQDFKLGVSYLEIYNENVQDLLNKSEPLHLRDDGKCGIIVAGLKIIAIQNAEELLSLLARGNKNRTQHPTDANQESSRSHAVFQVYISITNKLGGQTRHVKLSMIDLAGSERASVTGCKGARFKEGANINRSLLALGNCINNLADGVKHIPYRDSKLTRLLKDSLGGNCQTVMIANISPSSFSYEDTYNTLRYANRAKKIKTYVQKNLVKMHMTGYVKMVEEQRKEIEFLKQKLLAFESGLIQIPLELKETKVVEEVDSSLPEIRNNLSNLFNKKKILSDKIFSLESTDKILCCRMYYKKAADKRLHTLTADEYAMTLEEQNASGKSRINKSLDYFKRQRDSLRAQMEATWRELCAVELEIQKMNTEISEKKLNAKLTELISTQSHEIEKCLMQQQIEHAKKINSLQQCELHSVYAMNTMLSKALQNYYNLMRGYGGLTDKMKDELKQIVKSLEGVKNIKWCDTGVVEQEKDFYSLTCLSMSQLMDPLNNEPPLYKDVQTSDEEQTSPTTENLSTTFDLSTCDTENIVDAHNSTITLDEKPNAVAPFQNHQNIINTNKSEQAPSSERVPLQNKVRKHILSDKDHVNNKTPPKLIRKISPKQKVFKQPVILPGKENKKQAVVMSAKSIAIINKLKAETFKALPPKEEINNTISEEVALKAVRTKERRGLVTAHPYQKPRPKFTTASSSKVQR